ncbi:hypothetical protein BTO04_07925 [Polaribacter sp. SA4-10]|uniref:immunoglobulin-like domain-containing protein n=1 Tax=Polaribacter sp. SA4-10 TaxID=754397 RepID=UPI000B3BFAE4|nr:immunoglobulin-like domain-containing protein [Polaribacter sp. SA4-10]ARV06627.1 hypothetical protein BTO04_07925 [Polaribacter sp. SA4-10]
MKLVLKNSKLIAFFLIAITYVGCSEDVVKLPMITSGFTYTLNENTGTVEFINISENATTYSWDFGDEIPVVPASTSSEIDPIKSYTNGTYTVILKAMNEAGAISYFEDIIVINMPLPLGLPMTFDNDNVNYSATAFDGAAYELLENPAPGGSNDVSSMVASITNSGATYEGLFFELEKAIDLTTNNTIKMNFWSDAAVTILVKLEEGTAFTEVLASHTGSGWEELQFTFSDIASYSKLVVFVDGAGTTAGTFYMDDIIQISLGDAPVITLIGDETISLTKGDAYTEQGATASDTEDGDISGAIVIGGDTVDVDTLATYEVTYTVVDSDGNITVATRSIEVSLGDVPVITLIGDASIRLAQGDTYTEQGATASDTEDGDVTNTIVIGGDTVDTNTPGTYAVTYTVIDSDGNTAVATRNVEVYEPGACDSETTESMSATDLNVTFMSDQTANIRNDNATFEYVANPDSDNTVNNSCFVGKVTKGGVNPWDNNQIDFNTKFDLTANGGFKIKVYSAIPGYSVLLKLESIADPGLNTEIDLTTTKTNEWEELTFNFSTNHDNKYDRIVLIFDLNKSASTNTYYFDDLKLFERTSGGGNGGGDIPADGDIASNGGFESGDLEGWTLYDNGGTATLDNTEAQTGDWCVKLFASAPNGLNPTLKQERKAAGSIVVGDKVQVTFSYKGSLTGESGAVSIQSFVEATNGASQVETFDVTPTGTWQTFTTTYTVTGAMQGGDVSGGITMEFVAICGGVAGCTSTLYLDDISLIINP